ncbi:hypothetical protein TUM17580_32950 [Citrobacter farmeri]|nr:hypothetical protein TUM17580_32950 [Citrobacter farmeri]
MLQLCATTLNVTCTTSLKMNEMLIKEIGMTSGNVIALSFSLRYLTLLKGATGKSVRECNLTEISIRRKQNLM